MGVLGRLLATSALLSAAARCTYGELVIDPSKDISKHDIFRGISVTQNCSDDLNYYYTLLKKPWKYPSHFPINEWYFQMLDSTAKIADGIIEGNFNNPGNQLQCNAINVVARNSTGNIIHKFKGAFYTVGASVPISKGLPSVYLKAGICAPDSCTQDDIGQVYTKKIRNHYPIVAKNAVWHSTSKWTQDNRDAKKNLDDPDRAFIIFLAVLGLLLFSGTLLEYWYHSADAKCEKFWQKFLYGFGLYNSLRMFTQIAKPDVKTGKERLSCLDGMRFMSISWVVLGHTGIESSFTQVTKNFGTFMDLYVEPKASSNIIFNALVSVDSFFLISGCLVSYLILKEMEKTKGRFNIILWYLHRYLRLTGVYAFMIFFHATLLDKFFPNSYHGESSVCRKYWWSNIAYVNNFWHVGPDNSDPSCLGVTWYMACDMQYFILSPLIFMPLFFFKLPGLMWSGLLIVGSAAIPIYTNYIHAWPASPTLAMNLNDEYNHWGYSTPWNRFTPYMCGLLLGYFLHVTKKPGSFKLSGPGAILMWILASGLGMAVIFGLQTNKVLASGLTDSPSNLASAIYAGGSRLAWSLAVAWVIFACCRGYGGWINEFLSWEAFQPLSKVSFIVYLIHYDFLNIFFQHNQFDFPQDLTPFLMAINFLGIMSYSVLISGMIFVMVETPWLNTEKLLMGSLQQFLAPRRKSERVQRIATTT